MLGGTIQKVLYSYRISEDGEPNFTLPPHLDEGANSSKKWETKVYGNIKFPQVKHEDVILSRGATDFSTISIASHSLAFI